LAGEHHSLGQAGLINSLTDSAERIEPPLATLTPAKEVSDRLFDEFIGTLVTDGSEFLLDPACSNPPAVSCKQSTIFQIDPQWTITHSRGLTSGVISIAQTLSEPAGL
jgi:hypothetical protein